MKVRVKDLMTKQIKSIPPDMSAKDALNLLLDSSLSGVPVIDKDGNLVGVFTEKEILKAILPAYLKDVGSFVYADDPKAEFKKMAKLEKFKVKDLMRKEVPALDEESSITEASKIMLLKSERRVMVMKDEKVVGVITRCDVVKFFAKEAGIL